MTSANEIVDETNYTGGKKQSVVNQETNATLADHETTIRGLNSQNYVTVTATDQTTAVTDVLPTTGSVNTVYRVGNWDGSQYDVTRYSEYAWNGSEYKHLSTKTQIGEVFDISAYHASGGLAKYADLEAALCPDGENIPESLQKGGMTVQFVRCSYNTYVQYRLMTPTFSAIAGNWQEVVDSQLAVKLQGVTAEETKVVLVENTNWFDGKYINVSDGKIKNSSASQGGTTNGILIIDVSGYKKVRFLGVITTTPPSTGYGFSANLIDPTSTAAQITDIREYSSGAAETSAREYIVDVPAGMNYFACTIRKYATTQQPAIMTIDDFYCYTQSGYPAASTFKTGEFIGDFGVDEDPTVGSGNFTISGSVANELNKLEAEGGEITGYPEENGSIKADGTIGTGSTYKHAVIPVEAGQVYILVSTSANCRAAYATNNPSSGGSIVFADGTELMNMTSAGKYYRFVIPNGCTYLLFNGTGYNTRCFRGINDAMEIKTRVSDRDIVLPEWTANTAYVVGNQVQVDGHYYRCSTAHTSGETFDASDGWTEITDFVSREGNYIQLMGGNPILQNVLEIADFNTVSNYIDVGQIYYNTSTHLLRLKISGGHKTIPYRDGAVYVYMNSLYTWNGSDLVEACGHVLPIEVVKKNEGGFINPTTGNVDNNSNYGYSDYLAVDKVESIDLLNVTIPSTVSRIAFYDANKNFISALAGESGSVSHSYHIEHSDLPANTAYIRLNVVISNNRYRAIINYSNYTDVVTTLFNSIREKPSKRDVIDLYKNGLIPIVGSDDLSSYKYGWYFKLMVGKKYRIIFSNPSFANYATSSNYKLGIYAKDANDETVTIVRWVGAATVPLYYDFTAEYDKYYFGSRVNPDESLSALIVPIDALGIEEEETGILVDNPASEFVPKFQSAKKRYYTSTNNNQPLPVVIMHLSDIHGNWANVGRFLDFCNEYHSYIDLLVNTGDTVSDKYSDGITGYEAIEGVNGIINVIGNHDTRDDNANWQAYAGTQDAYNRYFAHVADWGVVQPSGIGENDYYPCYCYKDFATQKLRIVFVDVMAYDATEDTWLQGVLADTLDSENAAYGYHVLICAHMAGFMPNNADAPFTKIACNYSTLYGTASTAQQTNGYNNYAYHMIDTVDAFISNDGVFVGYLCGHAHYDYVAKKGTDDKQWIYCIGATKAGEMRDYKHVVGTRSQDEFQIVSVDTYTKTIKLFKVGANVDKYGRHKNSICIDYENHEIKCEAY